MISLTVPSILVALIVGLARQPLPIFRVDAWNAGTLKIEPWRQRLSSLRTAAADSFNWLSSLWAHRGLVVAVTLLLALLIAHAVSAAPPAGVLMAIPPALADPSPAELKKAVDDGFDAAKKSIDEGQRLFNEYKKTNDERIKQLEEKGVVDPLITQKLEKLNEAIEKQSKINDDFINLQATVNRLEKAGLPTGDAPEKREQELLMFNRSLASVASRRGATAPPALDWKAYQEYRAVLDRVLRGKERSLTAEEQRTLQVGVDADGGYGVTPDITGRIVTRIYETSPMRLYAASQTIGTDALEGSVDLDEATFGWVGESASRPVTNTPKVPAPWRIPVHEAYASPDTTQKMLEDANFDVVAWLARKVADKFARGFNAAFVSGNGTAKPRGFATYTTEATVDESRDWGKFEHILTGSNGSFGTDPNGVNKLLDLVHALKDAYTARAAFYLTRLTLGGVRHLRDSASDGRYVFVPSMVAGAPDTMLGYPIRKLQDMANYTTTGALGVAFGDMEETYLTVDRLGITVLVDPYTAKPKVIFYSRSRVGGDVVNFESLKFLKFS